MPDGRVIYTRWEYSDRGQLFVQGLFQMNPDGTGKPVYGNNSWFHVAAARPRHPGTRKVVAIFSVTTRQVGGWGSDRRGRQENAGTQLIAPVRDTPADASAPTGRTASYPKYPFRCGRT
jgi:hypothetical protein